MNHADRPPPDEPTSARIDQICDRFEAAWIAGEQPRAEEYLAEIDVPQRAALRRELLMAEWELRGQAGQTVKLEAYLSRFPHAEQEVRDAFDAWSGERTELTPNPTPLKLQPGATIGPYKLRQELGEGGMGTVYLAEQLEPMRRFVALKVIKPGMDSQQVVARFEAERQALALMNHTHIAQVLDAGATDSGRPYFVMELVKGVPITQFCDEHKLSLRERLELFAPVCGALQHAHQKGVIHRDIKPSNVLVATYDGHPVPKIIDFGVAKAVGQPLTEETLFTAIGQIVGTFEYMSPEQAELNQLDIDTRSDIYSLGVLLYELITGSPPITARELRDKGFAEMLRVIREEDVRRPSARLSDSLDDLPTVSAQRKIAPAKLPRMVAGDLDWIVMKALEKDRNRRYETPRDLAADIERYLNGDVVLARAPTPAYRLQKFAHRHRALLLTLSVILLTLLLATAISVSQAIIAFRAKVQMEAALVKEKAAKQAATEARSRMQAALSLEKIATAAATAAQTRLTAALKQEKTATGRMRLALANEQKVLAKLQDEVFFDRIRIAGQLWHDGSLQRAREVLWSCAPQQRNWVWRYLNQICQDVRTPLPDFQMNAQWAEETTPLPRGIVDWHPPSGMLAIPVGRAVHLLALEDLSRPPVKFLPPLAEYGNRVEAVAISPNGARLAAISVRPDRRIRAPQIDRWRLIVWNVETRKPLATIPCGNIRPTNLAFLADGALVTADDLGLAIWKIQEKRLAARSAQGEESRMARGDVQGLAASSDGRRIAVFQGRFVSVWNAQDALKRSATTGSAKRWEFDGRQVTRLEQAAAVSCIAFSPDGQQLAVATKRGIRVWDLAKKRSTFALRHPACTRVRFSPDGKDLVFAARDRITRLVSLQGGDTRRLLRGQETRLIHVGYLPKSDALLSISVDGKLLISQQSSGIRPLWFQSDGEEGQYATFAANESNKSQKLTFTNPHTAQQRVLQLPAGSVGPTISDDGRFVVCAPISAGGSEQTFLEVRDAESGKILHRLRLSDPGTAGAKARAKGDAPQQPDPRLPRLHSRPTISRDGTTVAAVVRGQGDTVAALRVVGLSTGQRDSTPSIGWPAFHPTGKQIFGVLGQAVLERSTKPWTPGGRLTIVRLDLQTGSGSVFARDDVSPTLYGSRKSLENVRLDLDPNGRQLAVTLNASVRLFDVASGKLQHRLVHAGNVEGLVFNRDGSLLSTFSDGQVRFWETGSCRQVLVLDEASMDWRSFSISRVPLRVANQAFAPPVVRHLWNPLQKTLGGFLGWTKKRPPRSARDEAGILGGRVRPFTLPDLQGKLRSLRDYADRRAVVVYFLGVECPLSKLYSPRLQQLAERYAAQGVAFLGVSSNGQDSLAELTAHARAYGIEFPLLKDANQQVAKLLGATRTPQVFLLDQQRRVRYYGRIDGQFRRDRQKMLTRSTEFREDLSRAINSLLAGSAIEVTVTETSGNRIRRAKRAPVANSEVTYCRQIARILQQRCLQCHRRDGASSFALSDYEEVAHWGERIAEAVAENRMPPGSAQPGPGHKLRSASLTPAEKQQIYTWVNNGCPEGDPLDLPRPLKFQLRWTMPGGPDMVLPASTRPLSGKKSGYHYFAVNPGFPEDKWVTHVECPIEHASAIRHIGVFYRQKSRSRRQRLLVRFAPGKQLFSAPRGWAKRIPAGSDFIVRVYYAANRKKIRVPNIGLAFSARDSVTHEMFTELAVNSSFSIPPHAQNHKVIAAHAFRRDALLLSLDPEMGVRAKSCRFELRLPDGQRQLLLTVPRYDDRLQTPYFFARPLAVPKGSRLQLTVVYDNSVYNFRNPDPTRSVRFPDARMIGWFDIGVPVAKATARSP